jgi:hypothetical protein
MRTYTDIENTGAPVVPDMRADYDRETWLEETVRSHRLDEPTDDDDDPADPTDTSDD